MRAVRRALELPRPSVARSWRALAVAGAIALLGLAAAQPALTRASNIRERSDAEALFVIDTSRSMAASATPRSPIRLERAVAAAIRMRAAIPDVPGGLATLTDRVLPDLLPVPDVAGFDAVAARAVAVEAPPPSETAVRATTYTALDEIASDNYFDPQARLRLVVLLTDGETNPVDAGSIAQALSPARGYRFVAVRFWHSGEAVYGAGGKPESAYQPDPVGRIVLDGLARALGGRMFEEGDLGAAIAYLREAAGHGPTRASRAVTVSRRPLAPYPAGIALVLLALALVPTRLFGRPVDSGVR
ncbi:MAG: hypothetical protein KGI93_05585 [Acidobacteriota bacterium]|nr:hypothetical protein [Acidobacteriota bacterium]